MFSYHELSSVDRPQHASLPEGAEKSASSACSCQLITSVLAPHNFSVPLQFGRRNGQRALSSCVGPNCALVSTLACCCRVDVLTHACRERTYDATI